MHFAGQLYASVVRPRSIDVGENTVLGALSSAAACAILMPLDTVKTRLILGEGLRGQQIGAETVCDRFFPCLVNVCGYDVERIPNDNHDE